MKKTKLKLLLDRSNPGRMSQVVGDPINGNGAMRKVFILGNVGMPFFLNNVKKTTYLVQWGICYSQSPVNSYHL